MQISDIMVVDPVTVAYDAVLSEAVRLMDEHGIRHLPVLNGAALVGVLSDRDLLETAGVLVPRLSTEGELEPLLVRDVMQGQPETVAPEEAVATAARALVNWGIGCLPVTRGRVLLGLVTETDVLEAFVASSRYGRLDASDDPPVSERMTAGPATADLGTTLGEVRQRMSRGDFRHMPVTDRDGRLLGLISDRDLRRAAGRGLPPESRVSELGRGYPTTADAGEPISQAASRMARERIGALPVVDQRKLMGILTVTDVLAHLARLE